VSEDCGHEEWLEVAKRHQPMDNELHLHLMFDEKKYEDDALISVCTLYQ
jgi:hypothetical protein